MQVNTLTSNGLPTEGAEPISAVRPPPTSKDQAVFSTAEKLRMVLEKEPTVRAEVVERGRELLADVQYPPSELINGLSKLLADFLKKPS